MIRTLKTPLILWWACLVASASVQSEQRAPDPRVEVARTNQRGPVRQCATIDSRAWSTELAARNGANDCTFFNTVINPLYNPGPTYQIPVVVHIITADDGILGDLSDAMVASQIAVLNEDFEAIPKSPGGLGEPGSLHFGLAATDPLGQPTSGITRTANSSWFSDPPSEIFKQSLVWDPERYLNIYTNDSEDLGYAYLPQDTAGEWWDGVVVYFEAFGRDSPDFPYDQGRTTTHEVGHYLGLFHPFDREGGDPACPDPTQPACYSNGDVICDTPPDAESHLGCQTGAMSCGHLVPVENYMEYSNDRCLERFTVEQINRMRCSLLSYRPNLLWTGYLFEDGFENGLGRWSVGESRSGSAQDRAPEPAARN